MKKLTRRDFVRLAITAGAGAVAAACAPAAPQIVEVIKEVPVEKEVIKEVVKEVPVEKVVEKEVVKEVPVEKVVEKVVTAVPVEAPPPAATPVVEYTPIPRPAGAIGLEVNVHWEGRRYNDYRGFIDEWNTGPGHEKGTYIEAGRIRQLAGGGSVGNLASYMADFQAGTSQDIYHEGVYLFWDMVKSEMVIPAPPEVEAYVQKNFLDAAAALSMLDGKCYGYPTEVQGGAMMVNGMALDAIGHSRDPESLPKTWEEFAELSMALTKEEGGKRVQTGWVWPEAYSEPWFELMDTMHASEGLPFIDVDKQKCNMDSEVGISLMKWYERMAVDDESTTLGLIGWYDAYPEGVGTMMLLNEWLLKYNILGQGGEELLKNTVTNLIPTRTGENFKSTFVTYNYMVSSQCKHPSAAWEFLQWLNEMPKARMGNWMVQVMGFVPNHKTGMPYPDWWTENMVETWTKATSKEIAVPYPLLPQIAKVQNICMDMANAVAQGSLTVEEACSQGATEIQQSVFGS